MDENFVRNTFASLCIRTIEQGGSMNIYISHMAALRFWRQDGSLRLAKPSKARLSRWAVCSIKDAKSLGLQERGFLYGKEHLLDVLVPELASRRYANELRPHVWSHELPKGAFRLVSPNVLVSSPEFVFVQLASVLSAGPDRQRAVRRVLSPGLFGV